MTERLHLGLWVDAGSRVRRLDEQLARHLRLVTAAEQVGFDSVWVGETYSFGMPAPLQWLAAIAPSTSMRIGTGVLLLPAWHPLRLAGETAVLDGMSGGRLDLGVGVARPRTQRRYGVDPASVATFADEMLEMLRVLWSGGDGFAGSIVRVDGSLDPLPVQPGGPPLWVGGAVRRSVLRAATFGDAWYGSTTYPFDVIVAQAERYRAELDARGRSDSARVAVNRLALVANSDSEAHALGAQYLGPLLRRYATNGSFGSEWQIDRATPAEIYDRLHGELCIVGAPDSAAAQLKRYADIGVTDVHVRVIPDEMPVEIALQTLRGIAEAVDAVAQPAR